MTTVADVMKQVRRQVILWIGIAGDLERAATLLQDHPSVETVERRNGLLQVTLRDGVREYADLPTALVEQGHRLTLFREEELNLETAFMALTKGITA